MPGTEECVRSRDAALAGLEGEVTALIDSCARLEASASEHIGDAHAEQDRSARNLVHYMALRERDLRPLQAELAACGLSSLGRLEGAVMESLEAVRLALRGAPQRNETVRKQGARLAERTGALLGPVHSAGAARIMVTMPSRAAKDAALVARVLRRGMTCMRINAAHDGPEAWLAMIGHLERAKRESGLACSVYIDLPGPKVRTGAIEPGPKMIAWHPSRDALGRPTHPARVALHENHRFVPAEPGVTYLPVGPGFVGRLEAGETLTLLDSRGRRRYLRIEAVENGVAACVCWRTAYVVPGCTITGGSPALGTEVVDLPPTASPPILKVGDTLRLTRSPEPGHPARFDDTHNLVQPATMPCTCGAVFDCAAPGQPVWFDDGKIGGIIIEVASDHLDCEITHCRARGRALRSDKGINFPETRIDTPILSEADRLALRFAMEHADIVGFSFIRSAEDVRELLDEMEAVHTDRAEPGIVLKIETRSAFEHLPEILLAGMRCPRVGVMIARGDLAVECGFERLAEVQEEILWLCEAAHIPTIWATQVLDTLVRKGRATRAEITDAAMSVRAECVMLNKGAFVEDALVTLRRILDRMSDHQSKKRAMLRPLSVARSFVGRLG